MTEQLVRLLKSKKLTLAVAESCTGGELMASIVKVPGASEVFPGGVVAYSEESKIKLLGVNKEIIKIYGAVSREVATEMAMEIKSRLGADIGIAVTGFAGPGGARVGEVRFVLCINSGVFHATKNFADKTRSEVIDASVEFMAEWICEKI